MLAKQNKEFWSGKRIVVLGAGKSGIASACFLKKRNNHVTLSEYGTVNPDDKQLLERSGIPFEENGHSEAVIARADIIIASPGIPVTAPPFQLARSQDIPVISEIELASQMSEATVIAITGSNGKTTTCTLAYQLLQQAGLKVACGGNIGTPLISLVEEGWQYLVVEVSSFQLETTFSFKPRIAMWLNLYPNHLDRHGTMAAYFAIKARLFQNQDRLDWSIFNFDQPGFADFFSALPTRQLCFSAQPNQPVNAIIEAGQIQRSRNGIREPVMPVTALPLKGQHNLENYLAVTALSLILDIPVPVLRETFLAVQGIPHRQEKVACIQGRTFVNDSKATNYLATIKALQSYPAPLILIAGGRDKGGEFAPLAEQIRTHVRHVFLIGEAAPLFEQGLAMQGYRDYTRADSLALAVSKAFSLSRPGDTILLSPACTSYDMFANFEKRGEAFKRHVAELAL